MPGIKNGMLQFSDQAHFDNYLAYLDAIVMDEPQTEEESDNDSTDIDAKLASVEEFLGFISLRAKLKSAFDALNQQGFASLDDIPAEHYIASSSLRSIFNEKQEVMIGESIWVYYNADFMVEITDASLDTRDAVHSYRAILSDRIHPAVFILNNIKIVPIGDLEATAELGAVEGEERTPGQKSSHTSGFRLLNLMSQPAPACIALTRSIALESGVQFDTSRFIEHSGNTNYVIDWGDGIIQLVGRVDGIYFVISHNYAAAGDYTVSVTGTFGGAALSANPAQIMIDGVGIACTKSNASTPVMWASSSGSQRAYSTEIQKSNVFMGGINGRSRHTATTKSYEWKNSSWKAKKVDRLVVQLFGNTHGLTCGPGASGSAAAWPFNSLKAEAVATISQRFMSNNITTSNHRMVHGAVSYSLNRSLVVCN